MKEEMPEYSITVLIEELEDRYNSGLRFIRHEDLMVLLMTYIPDRKGEV